MNSLQYAVRRTAVYTAILCFLVGSATNGLHAWSQEHKRTAWINNHRIDNGNTPLSIPYLPGQKLGESINGSGGYSPRQYYFDNNEGSCLMHLNAQGLCRTRWQS